MLHSTLSNIKDKVDINVYFVKDANTDEIASLVKSVNSLPQVATTTYTSSELALEQFRERHQNDQLTLQALDELGNNPLGASVNIKATDPSQYETIVKFLEDKKENSKDSAAIIDRINYTQNKEAIDALNKIINAANRLGLIAVIFFICVSVLITFNTIRLAIYVFREEIAVMRLVGASEMYIRGPFVTVGLMYGVISGLLTLIILYPFTYWVGPVSVDIGTGLNLFNHYIANFSYFLLVIVGSGAIVGALSSVLAIRKYLRV
jgi:cell division transport system permease protein